MNKKQWIVQFREERIRKRHERSLNWAASDFTSILREIYDYIYTPKQQVTIDLVGRYKEKLSLQYLKTHDTLVSKWKPEAEERARELMRSLVYCKNPFLSLIPKNDSFAGSYLPIPIKE